MSQVLCRTKLNLKSTYCLSETHNFVICFANYSNRIWQREESRFLWTGLNHNWGDRSSKKRITPSPGQGGSPAWHSAEQVVSLTRQTGMDSKQWREPAGLTTVLQIHRQLARELRENGENACLGTSERFQNSSIYVGTLSLLDRWRGWYRGMSGMLSLLESSISPLCFQQNPEGGGGGRRSVPERRR